MSHLKCSKILTHRIWNVMGRVKKSPTGHPEFDSGSFTSQGFNIIEILK